MPVSQKQAVITLIEKKKGKDSINILINIWSSRGHFHLW